MKSTKTRSTDLEGFRYLITFVLYDFSNLYFKNNAQIIVIITVDTENLKNTEKYKEKKFYNDMYCYHLKI